MNQYIINKYFSYLLIIIIFLIGIAVRSYNLNSEDFWTDEIFGFWTAEPGISFKETLIRTLNSNFNFLFDFLLKSFHYIFGYDVHVSRFLPLGLSIISLLLYIFFFKRISNFSSLIFGFFILSINIYHIKYSAEIRSYILTFLLALIFFILNFEKKKLANINFFRLSGIFFISVLMVFNHSFTLLIVLSFLIFKFLDCYKSKKFKIYDCILIISLSLLGLLYTFAYLPLNIKFIGVDFFSSGSMSPHWMTQIKPSFFTNFYFSQYFGSRILGLIHLCILIYLVIKFYKYLLKEFDIFSFFVILIIISYSVPVIYSFLFGPVLLGRFLIFLLIPIISLIAYFTFKVENKIVKYFFIFVTVVPTFANHLLYENSFKKFYSDVYPVKPEIGNALGLINISDTKFFTLLNNNAKEKNAFLAYQNYILVYKNKLEYDLKYVDLTKEKLSPKSIWVIHIRDAYKDFYIPKKFENYEIADKRQLNSLDIIKLKK